MNGTLELILAAIASFFCIALLFGCIFLICKSEKNSTNHYRCHQHPCGSELASITTDESSSFDPSLYQISMEELKTATKNFSTDLIVGDGSFGLVYKAKLSNGVTVAIKKLDPNAFQGFREFRAEMETLCKLRHPNIVKILGYCASGPNLVLIYEFMEKGSLDQWLYDTLTNSGYSVKLPLSWETRYKVVRGVAHGLAYLHGLDTPVIHRDIKASNVLLDSEFKAHIADFGLARTIEGSHSHVSTQVAGTMGYMPPEYWDGVTVATVKADVYSFGILMLEIATGERPNLPKKLEGKEVGLIEWARKMVDQDRHMEMLDCNMAKEGLNEEEVEEYLRIASMCTKEIMRDRPLMTEVVHLLNELQKI